MKITRRFVWAEHESTGSTGWNPLWIPREADFTPNNGAGIVHDTLEHALCDTGTFEDEIMAFGRIVALRLLPGVFSMNRYRSTTAASLGEEMHGIWESACPPPIEAPKLGYFSALDVQDELSEMVKAFANAHQKYLDSNGEHAIEITQKELNALYRRLKMGYLHAKQFYEARGGGSCFDLGWAGNEFAASFNEPEAEENSLLTVRVDIERALFEYHIRHDDPDRIGNVPKWLSRWYAS